MVYLLMYRMRYEAGSAAAISMNKVKYESIKSGDTLEAVRLVLSSFEGFILLKVYKKSTRNIFVLYYVFR